MSKLSIEQKNVGDLFTDKKNDFLIPDYQRPYAWGEKECQTLWDDIFTFAFPENDCDKFDSNNDEYFLGPIVTFKNEQTETDDSTMNNTAINKISPDLEARFN